MSGYGGLGTVEDDGVVPPPLAEAFVPEEVADLLQR